MKSYKNRIFLEDVIRFSPMSYGVDFTDESETNFHIPMKALIRLYEGTKFQMSVKCTTCDKPCSFRKEPFNADYTALLARHNALVEAVEWERETDVMAWYILHENVNICAIREVVRTNRAARAEVDRLIGEIYEHS